MAAVEENGQTERVSADLLATSVSKAVLAKEVLRLQQLRDELLDTTADSVPALEERCKLLRRDILDEEERGARETAELADHLARVRENLLAQREAAEARESGQAGHLHGGQGLASAAAAPTRHHAEHGDIGERERARFDAAFMQKILDVKRRLQDTSIEYATPLERSSGHVRGFLRSSNARIQVPPARPPARCRWWLQASDALLLALRWWWTVWRRSGRSARYNCAFQAQRESTSRARAHSHARLYAFANTQVHTEILELLRDNARLRISVNDYAEGLLADTFDLLDQAPGVRLSALPVG